MIICDCVAGMAAVGVREGESRLEDGGKDENGETEGVGVVGITDVCVDGARPRGVSDNDGMSSSNGWWEEEEEEEDDNDDTISRCVSDAGWNTDCVSPDSVEG